MKVDGVIFDLDGTLLDSMWVWDTIGEGYLHSLGIEPHENLNEKFKNMSLYQAACYYKSEYGVPYAVEKIMSGVNSMIEYSYRQEVTIKNGVLQFLELLKRKGIKMCIATATDLYLVEAVLKRNGIRDYFSEIFTCNIIGHGKDEPHIFNAALKHLGTVKEHTIVFEDALHAIETAKKAGFVVAAVFDVAERNQDQVRALSDFYIDDYTRTEEILL